MKRRPRTLTLIAALAATAIAIAGCGSSSSSSTASSTPASSTPASSAPASSSSSSSSTASATQIGFEGVPIEQGADLGSAGTTQTGTVDGIQCGPTEQLAYHIHAHLQVYVNGQSRSLPGGIGIPGSTVQQSTEGPVAAGGSCIYWLHTHAPDGVIHIESPTQRVYTLGNFFDEWHQPLDATTVAGTKGKLTVYVNGHPWTKNVRDIPLQPHAVVQISVGSPVVPFKTVDWSQTQL